MNTALPSTSGSACNHLAGEKSPYLQQHQHNPVDWHPWGEAAFVKSRLENKVIFLSIGYSTCHWCHVMERESFENAEIASFLNQHFVSVKVDREERPDVDRIYMKAVMAITGQGGWPLTVFLTPGLRPFFGGTYFPPETRNERVGFLDLLGHIQNLWQTRRPDVESGASELIAHIRRQPLNSELEKQDKLTVHSLLQAMISLGRSFDPNHGGFGHAPKFPQPSLPGLLLRCSHRFQNAEARHQVEFTCDRMAAGGIYDHLGGGFSRYSVDEKWEVPHFEKMLYDNAQLAQLYLDVFLISGEERHAKVARGILDYVRNDMTDPLGGFFSAEDADSEGKEGKFYCWTKSELGRYLSPEEFNVVVGRFGITDTGNFLDHSDPGALAGQNVLRISREELPTADEPLLASALVKMRTVRSRRIRPHVDDKILSSWNGLMLGAMARAAVILNEPAYACCARKNLEFIQSHLWDPVTHILYHRWREGEHDSVQLLTAYAFLLSGVIDLYEATLEDKSLEFAESLADAMLARFHDSHNGGFWTTPEDASHLLVRLKEDHDGAEPSGNSVATLALFRLSAIGDRPDWRHIAKTSLQAHKTQLDRFPEAFGLLMQALDFGLQDPGRIEITGAKDDPRTRALLEAAHQIYWPNKVICSSNTSRGIADPTSRTPSDKPSAQVCQGSRCHAPVHTPLELQVLLRRLSMSRD
jgi:hypothetical protein